MTSPVGGRHGVKAYTTPRSFGGFQIPIALQSAAIRRYCDEGGLIFHHHSSENLAAESFAVLESIVESANRLEGIAMCSVGMLPRSPQRYLELMRRCVSACCPIHFVFERFVVRERSDISSLTDLLTLIEMTRPRATHLLDLETSLQR